jgi:MoaD family protein
LYLSGWLEKSTPARDKFAAKTNLAVSSTKFCQCKFDEGNVRERLEQLQLSFAGCITMSQPGADTYTQPRPSLIKSHHIMPIVKLYANLRKLAGTKELSITGRTVGTVLSELPRQNPRLVKAILEGGTLRPHFVITINGHLTSDLDTPVTEQDVIAIFPPIAGGTSPLTPLQEGEGCPRRNEWLVGLKKFWILI